MALTVYRIDLLLQNESDVVLVSVVQESVTDKDLFWRPKTILGSKNIKSTRISADICGLRKSVIPEIRKKYFLT